jgi:hypothetical protein
MRGKKASLHVCLQLPGVRANSLGRLARGAAPADAGGGEGLTVERGGGGGGGGKSARVEQRVCDK